MTNTISPANTETSALFFDMKPLRMEVILEGETSAGRICMLARLLLFCPLLESR
jgi:hypothetical protein